MELVGGKIALKEKRLDDAWLDYLWRCDEETARLDATYPLKMRYKEFLRLFEDQLRYPTPASGRFAIDTRDGKFIGNCMYYDLDTINGQAEIGIVIGDKGYWGRGYGYDALVTMVEYLFLTTSLRKLYLHTLVWNKRAQNAFQKCGFNPINQVRRSGMEFLRMELWKEHWQEIREEKLVARDGVAAVTEG